MAVLSAKARKNLNPKSFAGPNRTWPIHDKAHVHAAISYYNAEAGKSKVSDSVWQSIGTKIASAARKMFDGVYKLVNGKIETPNTAEFDSIKDFLDNNLFYCYDCEVSWQTNIDELNCPSCSTQLEVSYLAQNDDDNNDSSDDDLDDDVSDDNAASQEPEHKRTDTTQAHGAITSLSSTMEHQGVNNNSVGFTVADTPALNAVPNDPKTQAGQAAATGKDCFGTPDILDPDPNTPSKLRLLDATEPAVNGIDVLAAAASEDSDPPKCPNCAAVFEWDSDSKKCNRCGSKQEPTTSIGVSQDSAELVAAYDSLISSIPDWTTDVFLINDDYPYELVSDSSNDGLIRVRQKAMRANAININKRYYPGNVVQAAIDDARKRINAGIMLCDYIHPEAIKKPNGEWVYEHRPMHVTARVDNVSDIGSDGWVYIDRTILNTDCGQLVADAIRSKKPLGLSTRFKMTGKRKIINGQEITVADRMIIHTWDDVPNPAFLEAGRDFALLTDSNFVTVTDSIRNELNLLSAPIVSSTLAQPQRAQRRRFMNEKLRGAFEEVYKLISNNASQDDVNKAYHTLTDEIKITERLKADGHVNDDLIDVYSAKAALDSQMAISGYKGGKPAPSGVIGNKLGTGDNPVQHPDLEANSKDKEVGGKCDVKNEGEGNISANSPGEASMDADMFEKFKKKMAKKAAKQATGNQEDKPDDKSGAKTDSAEFKTALDSHRTTTLKNISAVAQDHILSNVQRMAKSSNDIDRLVNDQLESYSKTISTDRLAQMGYNPKDTTVSGNTVTDMANPTTREGGVLMDLSVKEVMHPAFDSAFSNISGRTPLYLKEVSKVLLAGDDYLRTVTAPGYPKPTESFNKTRAENLKKLWPMFDEIAVRFHKCENSEQWFNRFDTLMNQGEQAFCDSYIVNEKALSDAATTTSGLWNQPTILTALLIQAFWNMISFQFVEAFGPGMAPEDGNGTGWMRQAMPDGSIGSVFRLPVEYVDYPNMTGFASQPLPQFNPGLFVPEGVGIDFLGVRSRWLSYAVAWRRLAVQPTRDVIKSMGNGPLNYPVVGRELFHMTYAHSRSLDIDLFNEMHQIADEYATAAVTNESANYTNNSSYNSGGSITVNLNPNKTAITAVASTDPGVQYGANVVAAIRFKTLGNGSSAPYCGSSDGRYIIPICRPRSSNDLNAAGQITANAVLNALTVTQTGGSYTAPHAGYLDANSQIQTLPGDATTANYAVDYNHGVIVFTAGYNALVASGSICADASSSTTTLSYSYITNYDTFQLNNPVFGNNLQFEDYLIGLLSQIDATAATLADYPNYVEPDLVLMNMQLATMITRAKIFWNWASPQGTVLFPTDEYFAARSNLRMARYNAPIWARGQRILVTQKGSTKLAVDTPWEVRGPQFPFDSSGRPIAAETYYGESAMVVATPQVTDQSNNILNHVSRQILVY